MARFGIWSWWYLIFPLEVKKNSYNKCSRICQIKWEKNDLNKIFKLNEMNEKWKPWCLNVYYLLYIVLLTKSLAYFTWPIEGHLMISSLKSTVVISLFRTGSVLIHLDSTISQGSVFDLSQVMSLNNSTLSENIKSNGFIFWKIRRRLSFFISQNQGHCHDTITRR